MAEYLPFIIGESNYWLNTALDAKDGSGATPYLFFVRWNSRDAAWYVDMYQDDRTPILTGIKIVLGTRIGAYSSHPFFQSHFFQVIDRANSGVDAAFDDLGDRIQLLHIAMTEFRGFGGA